MKDQRRVTRKLSFTVLQWRLPGFVIKYLKVAQVSLSMKVDELHFRLDPRYPGV